jgi:hypothetical protein
MADAMLGRDRADVLAESVWRLDRLPNIDDLFLLSVVK